MPAADSDDPMQWKVEEVLDEFHRILEAKLQGLPCGWWEDDSPRRGDEISALNFTRELARKALRNLRPSHRHKGPESDDNEKDGCAVYVFRYPIPGELDVDAYVKIALKKHPKKRGLFAAKWYSFKPWESVNESDAN